MDMNQANFQKQIGGRIQELRVQKKLSVITLAGRLGLTRQYIYAIEKGEHDIGVDLLQRIARALEVDASNLLPTNGKRKTA